MPVARLRPDAASDAESDAQRIARHRAFWERADVARPLLGTLVEGGVVPSLDAIRTAPGAVVQPEDLDAAAALATLEESWARRGEWVLGDALWSANPLGAFPWYLALTGCPVERSGDVLWARPAVEEWGQLDRVRLDPASPWLAAMLDVTRAAAALSRGRFPLGIGALTLGPVDTLMQARGQERLALDLHDAPELVEELGRRCVELCATATAARFAAVPRYLGGYAGPRCLWAPGEIVETAEDVAFLLSPAAHRRFVVPLHRALGRRFPYTLVHLHSTQLHTVPALLEVEEIAALEITPDFGEELLPYLPLLRRILERKPLILNGNMTAASLRELVRRLPARGLCIFGRLGSFDEAARALEAALAG